MKGLRTAILAVALCGIGPSAGAAPAVDVHDLTWWVHVDLTDQGAGSQPLSFYAGLIQQATADASVLVKGNHGPSDVPCCTELGVVQVNVFGTTGDGLDVPSSLADWQALRAATSGVGSHAFLVDSLGWCGSPTTTAIGCGDTPTCTGDPDDDPFVIFAATLEAYEVFDVLAQTIGHERGHNACLQHVTSNACQLMQPAAGGGCLDATECANYRAGRTGSAGECSCHVDALAYEPDGTSCTEGSLTGACSGGVCDTVTSDVAVQVLAAGGAESLTTGVPDDGLLLSGRTGGWTDLGAFGVGTEPRGLAYAPERGVVFGVGPTAGDDQLVTIDPATGAQLSTVGTLTGIQDVIALAFDPGPTSDPADDRLFALDDDATAFEDLLEIDPDTAAVTNRGGLSSGLASGFQGIAYDAANGVLYAASAAGLFTIDPASCPPGLCTMTQVTGVSVPRTGAGLSWSARTGRLYLVGNQFGDAATLFDSIEPGTWAAEETVIIEGFTTGGLAAVPTPLPACNDGIDNDGDGLVDYPADVGCWDRDSDLENPQCQDGINNDPGQDSRIDWDGGASAGVPPGQQTAPDSNCVDRPFRNRERAGCGLGFELALLLPALFVLRGRVRRSR